MASPFGAPPRPPLNAPPAADTPVGVQPGTSGIVLANLVIVFGPGGSQIVIGPNVPTVVINFYNSHGLAVNKMWIGMYFDANNYSYTVVGTLSAGTQQFRGEGWVRSGTLYESSCQFFDATHNMVDITHGSNASAAEESWYGGFIRLRNDITTGALTDMSFQNTAGTDISGPRGVVYYEQFTFTFTSTAVAGSEQVAFTTANSMTIRNGRGVRVTYSAQLKSAAVQNPGAQIRENNLAGTSLVGGPRLPIVTINNDLPCERWGIFVNTSGADVTCKLAFTVTPQAATAVVVESGSGSGVGRILVEDMGSTAQYSGVSVV